MSIKMIKKFHVIFSLLINRKKSSKIRYIELVKCTKVIQVKV